MVKKNAMRVGSMEQVANQIKRGRVKKPFPTFDDAMNTAKREIPQKRRGR